MPHFTACGYIPRRTWCLSAGRSEVCGTGAQHPRTPSKRTIADPGVPDKELALNSKRHGDDDHDQGHGHAHDHAHGGGGGLAGFAFGVRCAQP